MGEFNNVFDEVNLIVTDSDPALIHDIGIPPNLINDRYLLVTQPNLIGDINSNAIKSIIQNCISISNYFKEKYSQSGGNIIGTDASTDDRKKHINASIEKIKEPHTKQMLRSVSTVLLYQTEYGKPGLDRQ